MRKKKEDKKRRFCRDCAHATDFHSMSLKGKPILAKCQYQESSVLLNWDCCLHFKMRMYEKAKTAKSEKGI